MKRYLEYEYEKKDSTQRGDDFKSWHYKIRNTSTENVFGYRVEITKSLLSSKHKEFEIQNAVRSEGDSVVEKNLSEHREDWIVFRVGTEAIMLELIKKGDVRYTRLFGDR